VTESTRLPSRLVQLSPTQHDRDSAGLTYVYPVLSRRAGGVSVGINLNPNNACNWRCIYCQVPDLVRGSGPPIDLAQLERELRQVLAAIATGNLFDEGVPAAQRAVVDFALSGNGEPTSSPQFDAAIELLGRVRDESPSLCHLPIVLITNGSLADRAEVKRAISRLSSLGGRVWFKLDRGTDAGLLETNSTTTSLTRHVARLETVARLCPTFIQSCWFAADGHAPPQPELDAFVEQIATLVGKGVPLSGVQLYTVARQPQQPAGQKLSALSLDWLEQLALPIRKLGLPVTVSP